MKKICLLLALIMVFCFVVGCTGADNNADDEDAEETRVKKKKQITSDSEYDSDYDVETYYAGYETRPNHVTTDAETAEIDFGTSKNEYKNVKVGDYITFGSYEQDNNTSNGKEDIEWLVLDIQGSKALVISKYALDCKQYNTEWTEVTWETCTLRQWLNNDFLNTAFTNSQKSKIATTKVTAEDNTAYDTDAGNDTQDKIFLLSINEVNKYFNSDNARECKATEYAVANGAYIYDWDEEYYGNCWWWLRSPGGFQDRAARVLHVGGVHELGYSVYDADRAVRPALWINLNS